MTIGSLAAEILRPVVPFALRAAPVDHEVRYPRVGRIALVVDERAYRAKLPRQRRIKRHDARKLGRGVYSFVLPSQSSAGVTQLSVDELDAIYAMVKAPVPGSPVDRWYGVDARLDGGLVLSFASATYSDALLAVEDILRRSIGRPRPKGQRPPRVVKITLLP